MFQASHLNYLAENNYNSTILIAYVLMYYTEMFILKYIDLVLSKQFFFYKKHIFQLIINFQIWRLSDELYNNFHYLAMFTETHGSFPLPPSVLSDSWKLPGQIPSGFLARF